MNGSSSIDSLLELGLSEWWGPFFTNLNKKEKRNGRMNKANHKNWRMCLTPTKRLSPVSNSYNHRYQTLLSANVNLYEVNDV